MPTASTAPAVSVPAPIAHTSTVVTVPTVVAVPAVVIAVPAVVVAVSSIPPRIVPVSVPIPRIHVSRVIAVSGVVIRVCVIGVSDSYRHAWDTEVDGEMRVSERRRDHEEAAEEKRSRYSQYPSPHDLTSGVQPVQVRDGYQWITL